MQTSPIRYYGVTEAIRRLQRDAAVVDDWSMVQLCERALSGEQYALSWMTMIIEARDAFVGELVDELAADRDRRDEFADRLLQLAELVERAK